MITFKEYLTEKTFNVGKDVDYIFKKYFKKHIKKILDDKWTGDFKDFDFSFYSDELPSATAKKASKINKVRISNDLYDGNYYRPAAKEISVTLPYEALKIVRTYGLDDAYDMVGDQIDMFKDDISATRMKATIYHELSHWLDDTFHNSHIKSKLKVVKDSGSIKPLHLGKSNVNLTHFEIDAQIHALKQRKREFTKSEWDKLTWTDVETKFNPFIHLVPIFKKNKKEYNEWKKTMLSRLAREKLLGKNMNKNT